MSLRHLEYFIPYKRRRGSNYLQTAKKLLRSVDKLTLKVKSCVTLKFGDVSPFPLLFHTLIFSFKLCCDKISLGYLPF